MPIVGPIRTCVGCRRTAHSSELVRFVADGEGRLMIGATAHGRGAWLCTDGEAPRQSCLTLAIKRRAFAKALRRSVDESDFEAVQQQ